MTRIIGSEAFDFEDAVNEAREKGGSAVGPWLVSEVSGKWSGLRTVAFFVGACTAFWSTALSVLADERHQAPFIVLILAGAVVAFWAAGRP